MSEGHIYTHIKIARFEFAESVDDYFEIRLFSTLDPEANGYEPQITVILEENILRELSAGLNSEIEEFDSQNSSPRPAVDI